MKKIGLTFLLLALVVVGTGFVDAAASKLIFRTDANSPFTAISVRLYNGDERIGLYTIDDIGGIAIAEVSATQSKVRLQVLPLNENRDPISKYTLDIEDFELGEEHTFDLTGDSPREVILNETESEAPKEVVEDVVENVSEVTNEVVEEVVEVVENSSDSLNESVSDGKSVGITGNVISTIEDNFKPISYVVIALLGISCFYFIVKHAYKKGAESVFKDFGRVELDKRIDSCN